jgi:hypothetical protein
VFEIAKTAGGYASGKLLLVAKLRRWGWSFAGVIADAGGYLFGTTGSGGANGAGTVSEITGSGFVVFAGSPGKPNCFG